LVAVGEEEPGGAVLARSVTVPPSAIVIAHSMDEVPSRPITGVSAAHWNTHRTKR